MSETRIAATDRLRKAGLWEAACAFREQCRIALRAEGKSRQEAISQAWAQTLEKFPPSAVPNDLLEEIQRLVVVPPTLDELIAVVLSLGSSAKLIEDIVWGQQHSDDTDLSNADSPSLAAKFFAALHRQSPSRLFDLAIRYAQLHPSVIEG